MTGQRGSVTLEVALVMPLVALVAWLALGVVATVIDGLRLQEAARVGVRVAVTDADDAAVERAVHAVLGGGQREFRVEVEPGDRTAGSLVVVRVSVERRDGPLPVDLSARAVGVVEPLVGW